MANVPTPPTPSPTPFWGLGFRFELIGNKFYDIYENTLDVWLIGAYLSIPFYILATWFYQARDLTWDAELFVRDIKGWVEGLVSGNVYLELFYRLAFHTWQFINDVRGWFLDRLRDVSGDLYSIYLNARGWVEYKVIDSFPFIRDIRLDPRAWLWGLASATFGYAAEILFSADSYLRDKIHSLFPQLWSFELHPIGYIIDKLVNHYPWFNLLLNDPWGWVIDIISQRYPQLGTFMENPRLSVQEYVMDALNISYDPSLGFGGSILLGILKSLSILSSYILAPLAHLICDVIVKFM